MAVAPASGGAQPFSLKDGDMSQDAHSDDTPLLHGVDEPGGPTAAYEAKDPHDSDGTDGGDSDGTDGDSDGTDGTDSDGTDGIGGDSDGTDGDGTDGTDGDAA